MPNMPTNLPTYIYSAVYYAGSRKAYMGALASKASLQNEPILQALTSGNFVRKSRQR